VAGVEWVEEQRCQTLNSGKEREGASSSSMFEPVKVMVGYEAGYDVLYEHGWAAVIKIAFTRGPCQLLAHKTFHFSVNREGWAWERRYDEEGWAYRPPAVHQRCMPWPARRRAPTKTVWFH